MARRGLVLARAIDFAEQRLNPTLQRLGVEMRRLPVPPDATANRTAHILVAAFPKSASTYLESIIGALPGMSIVDLVPSYERREQELERARLAKYHKLSYVATAHVRGTSSTDRLIRDFGLRPVVVVRDIHDVLVSLLDHLRNEAVAMPMAYVDESMVAWQDHQLLEFLVEMAAPWYFNFYVSWARRENKLLLTYAQVVGAPVETTKQLVAYAGLEATDDDVDRAIERAAQQSRRLNVGRSGRGKATLTTAMSDRLAKMASYYSDVDFSQMGL